MPETQTSNPFDDNAKKIFDELRAKVNSDIDWRLAQAQQFGKLSAFMDYQVATNERNDRWQKDHQEKDDKRFSEILSKVDANRAAITSGISEASDENKFSLKQVIIGGLIALSTLGGWVIAVWLALRAT